MTRDIYRKLPMLPMHSGRLGGSRHTPAQIAARSENGLAMAKPCVCGHLRTRHRWQRDGTRAACWDCDCHRWRPARVEDAPLGVQDRRRMAAAKGARTRKERAK